MGMPARIRLRGLRPTRSSSAHATDGTDGTTDAAHTAHAAIHTPATSSRALPSLRHVWSLLQLRRRYLLWPTVCEWEARFWCDAYP